MEQKVKIKEQKEKVLFFKKSFKMRMAICDSDKSLSKKLKNLLYRYSELNKMDFEVNTFSSGEELLEAKQKYCLIFTEYELPGINGFETVKRLKEHGNNVSVIFLSKNTNIVFDAFKVSPYRFLKKPLDENKLLEALKDFFNSYSENYPLWITNQIDTYCLNTEEIYYLEADNKHCYVHLCDKTIPCNKTMARVFGVLPQKYFKKINRAYVINLNHILKFNSEYVYLKNGEKIHISRSYYKHFKYEYLQFFAPKIP